MIHNANFIRKQKNYLKVGGRNRLH